MLRSAIVVLGTLVSVAAPLAAQQSALRAAPSGRATTEVTLSYPREQAPPNAQPMKIRIDYGQPHLRGRTLHTDSLVPYDKPWRTGANSATTLTTDVDLVIGGAAVPKGSYVVYTLPGKAGWKLILQSSTGQSAMQYDAAHDVARIDLRVTTLGTPMESLTFWLIPSREPGAPRGELRMAWGSTQLSTDWALKP